MSTLLNTPKLVACPSQSGLLNRAEDKCGLNEPSLPHLAIGLTLLACQRAQMTLLCLAN